MEQAILEKALSMGAKYADIRTGSADRTLLEVKDREVKKAIYGVDKGASIRVLYDGVWGFSSTNDLSKRSLESALDSAFTLAKTSSSRAKERVKLAEIKGDEGRIVWAPEKNPKDISIDEKYELLLDLDKHVKDIKGVHSVSSGYSDWVLHNRVVTTDGINLESQVTRTYVRSSIIAKEGTDIIALTVTTGGTGGFEIFDADDPVKKAVEGGKAAVRILSAEKPPSGKLPIITDHDLTGVFAHEALGHATEADIILSGSSCLEGKIGENIGSDVVTIIDDPTMKSGFGSFPFDDEGVRGQRKILVDKGVLKDYILNREAAHKLGMTPNGGARAESYAARPLVRMSNTVIAQGGHSFEELLEGIKLGVYAKGSRGGQVSTAKGTFQFNAQEAFLIENGEITRPLKDVSFSGATLEILKSIDAVGNDMKFGNPGSCGKGQWVPVSDGGPHVRVKEAVLGGA